MRQKLDNILIKSIVSVSPPISASAIDLRFDVQRSHNLFTRQRFKTDLKQSNGYITQYWKITDLHHENRHTNLGF